MDQADNSKTAQIPHIDAVFSRLSDLQWRFVTAMVENPAFSKKEAAEYIGITPSTVYRWPKFVDEAIELSRRDVHEAALVMRRQAVMKAVRVKIKLLDSEDESVRSKVASEIIEWELGKAVQRNEHTGADGEDLTIKIVYADSDAETA